jgi:hypothetical protein
VGLRWYLFALVALPAMAGYVFIPDGTDKFDDPGYL